MKPFDSVTWLDVVPDPGSTPGSRSLPIAGIRPGSCGLSSLFRRLERSLIRAGLPAPSPQTRSPQRLSHPHPPPRSRGPGHDGGEPRAE
eukprot:g14025.t1